MFGAPADQPLRCAGIPALPSTLLTMPRQLPSPTQLSPPPQDFASLQAPPLPRCLWAEPKINGCLSDASLDKPRFALKAQVLQIAPPPPLLAHLCSLTHTLPPLSRNLCSLCQSGYYRKRGSASYIVREWLLWEGERERERDACDVIDIMLKLRVIMHMITSTARWPYASTRSEPVCECSKFM